MKPGELIAKRYRLEDELGRGGMAVVWCATDTRLDRPVAVKFLAPEFSEDPEFLVRFFTEAQSAASLAHPNVVAVLDFGDFENRPYLVMEYVAGGSVADVAVQPLMPERALEIIERAARGAGAAHLNGVVHRDIKPANILLDDEGHPKLADFGIAAARGGERMTATGDAIGSPHYISPEQVSGRSATPASDVYSLGVVLYQLLTGVRPFEHENITAVAISHVDEEPDPPSDHIEDLDPALDALVLRCLAKDP
ncbi:MAG: serine/threonine-protein kinase, partial [Actinomycetota bacterium]